LFSLSFVRIYLRMGSPYTGMGDLGYFCSGGEKNGWAD
jgi:hypothetical protein